jgi:RNA polymerase sigma-70 factor (ECF subfamily)
LLLAGNRQKSTVTFSRAIRLSIQKTMAGNEPIPSRSDAEERLLIEAAQRDPARFVELYDDNFPRVYAYIVRRLRDREAAEDLTSAVFHKALENLPRFTWRGVPFGAWLMRIASNMIADQRKRAGKEQSTDVETLSPPHDQEVSEDPQLNLEKDERIARLIQLVDQLPEDQRRVIALRFGAEKSIREIADQLGRTEGAIKQLQFRGLESLRSRLSSEHG